MADFEAIEYSVEKGVAWVTLNRVDEMPLKEAYRTEQEYTARLSRYEDSAEALAAFREKRPPRFKGR